MCWLALGWGGPAEILGAVVIAHGEGAGRQASPIAAPGSGRKLSDRGRDAEHDPVPEPRSGRRIRVEAGHGEPLSLRGEPVPTQLGRDVLAGHPEAVVNLSIAHGLAVGDVVAL